MNRPSTIAGLATALRDGRFTTREWVQSCLDRVQETQGRLAAFTAIDPSGALGAADECDRRLRSGTMQDLPPLFGVTLSIKDTIDVHGLATTACSPSHQGDLAQSDAGVVRRLRQAGAIVLGKANCHEYAFGGPAFDLPFPPARNPWNADLFPGGSSSGSGVSVAANCVLASIGTDTAGSVRLPATHCGVVGLKPTYGRVSMQGVRPLSLTMDHVGPLTGTVDDCRAVFDAIRDASLTSSKAPMAAERDAIRAGDCRGLRVGIAPRLWGMEASADAAARLAYDDALSALVDAGAAVVELALPSLPWLHAAAGVTMMAEVARHYGVAVRSRYHDYGEIFRNRVLVGQNLSAEAYLAASQARVAITAQMAESLSKVDVLLLPGSIRVAGPLQTVDKFYFLKEPNLNAVANFTGQPALALPVALTDQGVPVGIQLLGAHDDEDRLLNIGERFEALMNFRQKFCSGLPFRAQARQADRSEYASGGMADA